MEQTIHRAYIAMGIEASSMDSFTRLQELVQTKIQEIITKGKIKTMQNPHLTLDFLGDSIIENGRKKAESIKRTLKEKNPTITCVRVNFFISDKEPNKYIYYIEVSGGENFFTALQDSLHSIRIPHITICEVEIFNQISDMVLGSIIADLNNNTEIQECIKNIYINNRMVTLRYKDIQELSQYEIFTNIS